MSIQLRLDFQQNRVGDEVSAITAVTRPVLQGLLNALKSDVVSEVGGYEQVKLKMLPRLHRPGDGDIGICFEYAVHDGVLRREPCICERIEDALSKHCKLRGKEPESILFGAEKTGSLRLIDTAKEMLTDDSHLLAGSAGRPAKLKRHIDSAAAAFRRRAGQGLLPWSIEGIWKADLFLGHRDSDQWVGTSVKINRSHLEPARGLRLGLVPTKEGRSDVIEMHKSGNLIVCPIPHDQSFMEVFYQGWGVVQQVLHADAKMPKEAALPRTPERQVARYLVDRREFPVVDVIEALLPLSQPELLVTETRDAAVVERRASTAGTESLEVPMPRVVR